jgi:hypothetical protein
MTIYFKKCKENAYEVCKENINQKTNLIGILNANFIIPFFTYLLNIINGYVNIMVKIVEYVTYKYMCSFTNPFNILIKSLKKYNTFYWKIIKDINTIKKLKNIYKHNNLHKITDNVYDYELKYTECMHALYKRCYPYSDDYKKIYSNFKAFRPHLHAQNIINAEAQAKQNKLNAKTKKNKNIWTKHRSNKREHARISKQRWGTSLFGSKWLG